MMALKEERLAADAANREWKIPAPGAWELDSMHFPVPLTPYHARNLEIEFPRGFREGTKRFGLLLDYYEHAIINGFDYNCPRIVGAPKGSKGPPPKPIFKLLCLVHPEIRRRLRTCSGVFAAKPWRQDWEHWRTVMKPEAIRVHTALQATDPVSMDDEGLRAHVRACLENGSHQVYQHHVYTISSLVPVGDYLARTSEWTGIAIPELLQGWIGAPSGDEPSRDGEYAKLVSLLRKDERARLLLLSKGNAEDILAGLVAARGETGSAAAAWIQRIGERLITGYDIVDRTARELPGMLVKSLKAAMEPDLRKSDSRLERAERIRDKVPATKREAYDAMLEDARLSSALREERALFTDLWAYGLARRALLEAGKRLTASGRISSPAALLEATPEEIQSLMKSAGGPTAADLESRLRYRESATSDTAPKNLGFPPSPPPPSDWLPANVGRMMRAVETAVQALFFEPAARSDAGGIHGLAASAGSYIGRARLVLGPESFAKVEPGDVLVARSTSEAYNVLLPLLGAVVTDRGGLLSHAANVAREFGIPAVVGTGVATQVIPDGARVQVLGESGCVRILA
jgi:pyruvate,water dikinase